MEKIKDKDTFSNVFYNATRGKRNIFEIKSPRFTTVAFLSTPIHQEAKNRRFHEIFSSRIRFPRRARNFSIHAEHSLSYRRHVRIVSRARFAPFLRVLWRREVCGAKLLTRVERVAGSAVTFFGSHEIRKAGSTLRTVMVPQVCPMASFATFAASNSPFLTPSVRFLPISLRNVIDNRCIKRSLPTFPPFDFSRNRKSFFFLFLKSRVG